MKYRQLSLKDQQALEVFARQVSCTPEFNWSFEDLVKGLETWELWAYEDSSRLFCVMAMLPTANYHELLWIQTLAPYRRHGYAQKLMEFWLNNALHKNLSVLLEVHEKNLQAQQFYAKLGFHRQSERKKYYSDGASAWLYTLKRGTS
jgi:ribosomal protein S18 acetylase RimI-like enzyme